MTPDFARRSYQEVVEHILGNLTAQGILTDTAPGSVTRTLVEATSREFAELYARMNAVYEAGFLDTATGSSLDQIVALIGLTRLAGETDIVEIRLQRDNRVSARVIIPAGAQIVVERQGRDRVTYVVLDGDELRAGEDSIVITLRALPAPDAPDAELDINADDVTLNAATFVAPIAGIASLALEQPSVRLGTNETDEQLRERARMAIASAGGGTEKALEQALLEVEGVEGVRLRDAGDPIEGVPLKPGEIEVILDGKPQILEQNRDAIKQAIARAKGPGIVARLGSTQSVALGGRVVIKPASPVLSGEQALTLVRDVEDLLTETVSALEIGAGLQWNRLLANLMGVENLGDVLVNQSEFVLTSLGTPQAQPLADITIKETERLIPGTDGEALVVVLEDRPGLVVSVQLDAQIVEPTGPLVDQLTAELTQGLINYLETLDTSKPGVQLSHVALVDLLTGPDGVTVLKGEVTAANLTISVLETDEGSLKTLTSTGTILLDLPQNGILRSDDPAATVTWQEPS
ncbi:baseplate J/gp47 family protein [Yoonia sp. SS1-5]|uniref:Baseplate J/gp47 family protein n=1 Tax=Yoonia rhodophyticola TaxID=3137370 RepID=A0AAN0MCU7_9RHOB